MASAPKGSVRIIDPMHRVHTVNDMHGHDTNSILEDILDVPSRPAAFKEKLMELARHIEDDELVDARALLRELESELGTDAEVVAAAWELEIAEKADAAD